MVNIQVETKVKIVRVGSDSEFTSRHIKKLYGMTTGIKLLTPRIFMHTEKPSDLIGPAIDLYSASIEDLSTKMYYLDFQETGNFPNKIQCSIMNLLVLE